MHLFQVKNRSRPTWRDSWNHGNRTKHAYSSYLQKLLWEYKHISGQCWKIFKV